MLPRHHPCIILVKNVADFCTYPKTQPKAKVKRFQLIALAEEISKQPNIDTALLFILMKMILLKQCKLRKEKNAWFKD